MENLTQNNRNVNLPHVNVSRVNTLEIYETTSFENFGLHNFMLESQMKRQLEFYYFYWLFLYNNWLNKIYYSKRLHSNVH